MDCTEKLEDIDLLSIAREWEKKIFQTNTVMKNYTIKWSSYLTTCEGETDFKNRIIKISTLHAQKSNRHRLDCTVVHELVHAHLDLKDQTHKSDPHGDSFEELRKSILNDFELDIGEDERSKWSYYEQAVFYNIRYCKWQCSTCGYEIERLRNSRKPDGGRYGYHENCNNRDFHLIEQRDPEE